MTLPPSTNTPTGKAAAQKTTLGRGASGKVSRLIVPPSSWQSPDTHYESAVTHPWYRAVVELTDVFHYATVEFWRSENVRAAYFPVTTGSISSPMGRGSDSAPVHVTVEGVDTFLADSMQFMLEYGCRICPQGCYYVMPSFRGEAADRTHLCQFYHSEAEIPGDLDAVIGVVERYLRHITRTIVDDAGDVLARLTRTTDHAQRLVSEDIFQRIEFDEALHALGHAHDSYSELEVNCRSLTRTGEQRLMEKYGEFLWVTNMDHLSVPFYQAFDAQRPTLARNGDLLFGVGETVGCGERHADPDGLLAALKLHEVNPQAYSWYLRMREIAPMQTSGFGMGVERYLLWLMQHDDIRDIPIALRFNGQQIDP